MANTEEEYQQILVYPPHVQYNSQSLHIVKFLSSSFAGAAAGVLGLENLLGFGFFAVSTLITSVSIWLIRCQGRPKKYMFGGMWELVNPGQDNLFSYILFWTLFYGALHDFFQPRRLLFQSHVLKVYETFLDPSPFSPSAWCV
ncbi:hypothetical protein FRB93_012624 [Tulasnella sp. JGI-2019a]|nr:hypothetical protein FRB93_012624 [Tulasnella sp. JGI-2019a]